MQLLPCALSTQSGVNNEQRNKVMLEELKKEVFDANLKLVEYGLVMLTWGNASGIDREKGLVVIKPSGVDYSIMRPEDMVVVDLDGKIIDGRLNPSSDTPTHLELYRSFDNIGGIVHTHSTYATSFAQASEPIIPLGTTHADYFSCAVPVTRELSSSEIRGEYEKNTGKVIIETFISMNIDYENCPAVLVSQHAPFTWGKSPSKAAENAFVLERVAQMNILSFEVSGNARSKQMDQNLLGRHFFRKHGPGAYYGQQK